MSWARVTTVSAIEPGHAEAFDIVGLRIVVCNTEDGYFAVDDECTHDGGSLDQGILDGREIECPRHGARFDVTTGKVICLPAVRPIQTYVTRLVDGHVEVEVP
jgi:3-phenylpropionate/trans-cinnamate dioxygenase ferredoxin subunit